MAMASAKTNLGGWNLLLALMSECSILKKIFTTVKRSKMLQPIFSRRVENDRFNNKLALSPV